MAKYFKHKDAANKLYKSISPDVFDASMEHADDLHKYIHKKHQESENDKELSAQEFINHIGDSFKNSLNSSKTDKNKKEKTSMHTNKSETIHSHSADIDKTLKLHNHLMQAKNVLFHAMCKSIPWLHSLNEMPVSPEGIVAFSPDGTAVKYVDRTIYKKSDNKGKK